MRELKHVATNTKEEANKKFRLLVKKTARTKQPKTFQNHISQLVEFIENNPIFENLQFKWAKEIEEGIACLHGLKLQVYNKSKMAYTVLKSRLIDEKLINLPEIDFLVFKLETLFTGKERNCLPEPWLLAFDGVKKLGIILQNMDRSVVSSNTV